MPGDGNPGSKADDRNVSRGKEGKKPQKVERDLRMLSPSQINTYLRCPRKWFYRYILKIPEEETFPLARGKAVHSVLEDFYDYKPAGGMSFSDLEKALMRRGRMLLSEHWRKQNIPQNFPEEDIDDTQEIIDRFVTRVVWKVRTYFKKYGDLSKSWNYAKPKRREYHIRDEDLGIQGFIDAVLEKNGKVILVDYKTSSIYIHPHSSDYERQLMLYGLMYKRDTGVQASVASIDYLLYGEMFSMPIREEMLQEAEVLIKAVRAKMDSKKMEDYPRDDEEKFCNWCSYQEICWSGE